MFQTFLIRVAMNSIVRLSVVCGLALSTLLGGCGGGNAGGSNAADGMQAAQALSEVPTAISIAAPAPAVVRPLAASEEAPAIEGLRVVSMTKTAEVRVSRTVYDYVFTVKLANGTGTTWASASAVLEAVGAGSSVIDGLAQALSIAPQATVVAADTVTLRHDRTKPFDAAALRWRVQGSASVSPGPVALQVSTAQVKPSVEFVGDRLVPVNANSGLVLTDPQAGAWPVGKLIVRQGNVYRVLGSTVNARGQTEISVEPRPFHEAFDQLAFKAQFGALLYNANGLPLVPASPVNRAFGFKGNGKMQVQTPDDLRKLLGMVDCAMPTDVVETDPEKVGYHIKLNCTLADLLRMPDNEALKSVYIEGGYDYTAKTSYVFDKDARDNYVTEERKAAFALSGSVNVLQALKTAAGASDVCKVDDADVTCELELARSQPLRFPLALVGGVIVSGDAQFFWKLSLKLSGKTTFSYALTTQVVRLVGLKGGVKRDEISQPETVHSVWNPDLSANTTGMFDASTSVGVDVNLGTLNDVATIAKFTGSLGYSVRAGAVSSVLQPSSLCFTTDKAVVAGVESKFFPMAFLDFDGISGPEYERRFPIGQPLSLPVGCVAPGEAGELRFLYALAGAGEYAARDPSQSSVGRDAYSVSGAWLQDKKSGATTPPYFQIDLLASILEAGVPWEKVRVTAGVPVKPEGSGAYAQVVAERISSADPRTRPVVHVYPGNTMPGQTLVVAMTLAVEGQPERTVNRQVQLNFEPLLDAEPTYRYTVDRDGYVHYHVVFNYKGSTQSQLAGVLVEMAHPDGPVVERVDMTAATAPGTGNLTWYYPPDYNVTHRQLGNYQLVPTTLILESKATSGRASSYRIPIVKRDNVQVGNPFVVEPALAYVGDTLKFIVTGDSLPDDLAFSFPACRDIQELRSAGLIAKNLFSTEYRVLTCKAVAASFDTRATVLGGLGYTAPQVGFDANVPTIRVSSAIATVGESINFVLTQLGDWFGRARQVVWSFASVVQTQTTDLVTSVDQAFQSAGVYEVVARLRNVFDEATLPVWFEVGSTRTTVTITAAPASVVSVDPLVATAGVPTTFNVTGVSLPPGLKFLLPGCDATEVTEGSSDSLRRFKCAFAVSQPAGPVDGTVAYSDSPFGAPPLKSFTVQVKRAAIQAIAPAETIRTLATSFEISGVDLPLSGLSVTVPGDGRASCQAPNNLRATGFGVACELYRLGPQTLEVRQGAAVLGTVTVNVKSNVTGVSWTSPSTSSSGTVRFGETVTFKVAGTNLLADPVMGFAVEKCGVSNVELPGGTNSARQFSCLFNNEAGAVAGLMPGVVKDAPGGQVLLDGWSVPVEVPTGPVFIPPTDWPFESFTGQSASLFLGMRGELVYEFEGVAVVAPISSYLVSRIYAATGLDIKVWERRDSASTAAGVRADGGYVCSELLDKAAYTPAPFPDALNCARIGNFLGGANVFHRIIIKDRTLIVQRGLSANQLLDQISLPLIADIRTYSTGGLTILGSNIRNSRFYMPPALIDASSGYGYDVRYDLVTLTRYTNGVGGGWSMSPIESASQLARINTAFTGLLRSPLYVSGYYTCAASCVFLGLTSYFDWAPGYPAYYPNPQDPRYQSAYVAISTDAATFGKMVTKPVEPVDGKVNLLIRRARP